MRRIGQLLLLLLMVTAIGWAWQWIAPRLPAEGGAEREARLERARVAVAYRLDAERWTDFPLLPADRRLRVITNADLPLDLHPSPRTDPAEQYPYAIAWRLLDGDDGVLREGVYHLHTRLSLFTDPESGEVGPRGFYYPARAQPGDGRGWMINLSGESSPARLQLRLAASAPPVEGVVARLYRREAVAEHKLTYRWQRMGEAKRERLARASVYSRELLRDDEKRRLLANRWLPVGPSGVAGSDYRVARLHLMESYEGQPLDTPIPPSGVAVGPGLNGVIPIPGEGGRLRFEWRPERGLETAAGPSSGRLAFHWYGHPASRQRRWSESWSGGGAWSGELAGGLVELTSPLPLAVRVWLTTPEGEREITPEPRYLRLFAANPEPLRYTFGPGEAGPLRLDLRRRLDESVDGTAHYRVLDRAGETLLEGVLDASERATRYERAVGAWEQPLSEPRRHHFNLPPESAELRLEAPAGLLFTAYSRPAGLPTQRILPSADEGEVEIPAWFPRRPADHAGRLQRGGSLLIQVRRRPPEVDPEILAGRYQWESYLPEGAWRGRHLLLPRAEEAAARTGSEGTAFHPLADEGVVRLVGSGGMARPRLLFLRPTSGRMKLKLWLDGRPWLDTQVGAASGMLTLPAVAVGEHRLRVEHDGEVELLMDGVAGDGAGHLRQLALKLGGKPLRFLYDKQSAGEELLSLRIHGPERLDGEQRIRLRIEGLPERSGGPYAEWSLAQRDYRLREAHGEPVALIGANRRLDGGNRLFIPLGADLPPARYRLVITLEEGPGGYLLLSRSRPGLAARREVVRE